MVLWCYLIWYAVTVYFYFDPTPRIWLNSLGISILIGIALILSVSRPAGTNVDHWQTLRLFMMPFCVSSFSSLIKGHGFIFIIPPKFIEQATAVGACSIFVAFAFFLKTLSPKSVDETNHSRVSHLKTSPRTTRS